MTAAPVAGAGRMSRVHSTDTPGADGLTLVAAAYLHDLVNVPKNAPDRHLASKRSAEAAVAHLRETDFPVDRLPAVPSGGLESSRLKPSQ